MSGRPSPIVHFQRSGVQRVMKRAVLCCCFAFGLFLLAIPLPAQQAPAAPKSNVSKEIDDKLAQLDQRITAAQSAGDNAWMLTSTALVLMMTGPGLALFYGGLVRRKKTLAIMMQSFAMMGLVTVLWALFGYSLAFGEGSAVVGDLRYLFLNGVGAAPDAAYAAT